MVTNRRVLDLLATLRGYRTGNLYDSVHRDSCLLRARRLLIPFVRQGRFVRLVLEFDGIDLRGS